MLTAAAAAGPRLQQVKKAGLTQGRQAARGERGARPPLPPGAQLGFRAPCRQVAAVSGSALTRGLRGAAGWASPQGE